MAPFWVIWVLSPMISLGLDAILGDPYHWPHPVKWIGKLILRLETPLRRHVSPGKGGEIRAGRWLVLAVVLIVTLVSVAGLALAAWITPWLALGLRIWFSYQFLATRCLVDEAKKTAVLLEKNDLAGARRQTANLVGRETKNLSHAEIIRANVETVAENLTDGIIAPLFWLTIGGLPLLAVYKAINTMDSMVGYRSPRFINYGRAAARIDDVVNFIPARIAGVLIVLLAYLLPNYNGKGAREIFVRDRLKHLSPNSAQTEAPIAGAIGIKLGGPHVYFGQVVDKPWLGDSDTVPAPTHIYLTNHLIWGASFLFGVLASLCATGILFWFATVS
ncbi:MAG TPA: cobalamin biosynthesis protein CobD [Clostridiaceae bacterium]|nr:cobalamin biosynthesis protein CobD [Clostridiaceae bacterium]